VGSISPSDHAEWWAGKTSPDLLKRLVSFAPAIDRHDPDLLQRLLSYVPDIQTTPATVMSAGLKPAVPGGAVASVRPPQPVGSISPSDHADWWAGNTSPDLLKRLVSFAPTIGLTSCVQLAAKSIGINDRKVVPMHGDGLCLFRAVAHHRDPRLRTLSRDQKSGIINGVDSEKIVAVKVHHELADYVEQHREDYEPYVAGEFDFQEYVRRLRRTESAEGDELLVLAVARMYDVIVRVYELTPNGDRYVMKSEYTPNPLMCPLECVPTLEVLYSKQDGKTTGHYDCLVSTTGVPAAPALVTVAWANNATKPLQFVKQISPWHNGAHVGGWDATVFHQWFMAGQNCGATRDREVLNVQIGIGEALRLVHAEEMVWAEFSDDRPGTYHSGKLVHYDGDAGCFEASFEGNDALEGWISQYTTADVRVMIAARYMQWTRPWNIRRELAAHIRGHKIRLDIVGKRCSGKFTMKYIQAQVKACLDNECATTTDDSDPSNAIELVQAAFADILALVREVSKRDGIRIREELSLQLGIGDGGSWSWRSLQNFAVGQTVLLQLQRVLRRWWTTNTDFVERQTMIIQKREIQRLHVNTVLQGAFGVIGKHSPVVQVMAQEHLLASVGKDVIQTLEPLRKYVKCGTCNIDIEQHLVRWVEDNVHYVSELGKYSDAMQSAISDARDQLRHALDFIDKQGSVAQTAARNHLLASVGMASLKTTELLRKFAKNGSGDMAIVQHLVRWARENPAYMSDIMRVAASTNAAITYARDQLRHTLDFIDKQGAVAQTAARDHLLASVGMASLKTTELLRKFAKNGSGDVDIVQHLVRWARENPAYMSDIKHVTASTDAAITHARDQLRAILKTMDASIPSLQTALADEI
jgi:hypothetical protein